MKGRMWYAYGQIMIYISTIHIHTIWHRTTIDLEYICSFHVGLRFQRSVGSCQQRSFISHISFLFKELLICILCMLHIYWYYYTRLIHICGKYTYGHMQKAIKRLCYVCGPRSRDSQRNCMNGSESEREKRCFVREHGPFSHTHY